MARVDEEVEGEIVIERRRRESEEGGRLSFGEGARAEKRLGEFVESIPVARRSFAETNRDDGRGEEGKGEVVVVG